MLVLNGLELVGESRQKHLVHQRCRQGAHVAGVGVGILVRRTTGPRKMPLCSGSLPCPSSRRGFIFALCRVSRFGNSM